MGCPGGPHLGLLWGEILSGQQVALHQVDAVVHGGADEDGQGNGFHGAHLPAAPVHDGHHQADDPCRVGDGVDGENSGNPRGAVKPAQLGGRKNEKIPSGVRGQVSRASLGRKVAGTSEQTICTPGWQGTGGGGACREGSPGPASLTEDAQQDRQQEQHMGGEHSHSGHADEQGQGQAIQSTLHPCGGRRGPG